MRGPPAATLRLPPYCRIPWVAAAAAPTPAYTLSYVMNKVLVQQATARQH